MAEPYVYDEHEDEGEGFKDDRYLTIDGKTFDVHNIEADEIKTAYQAEMILIHCQNKLDDLIDQIETDTGPINIGDTAKREHEEWLFRTRRAKRHTQNHVRLLECIHKERQKNETNTPL